MFCNAIITKLFLRMFLISPADNCVAGPEKRKFLKYSSFPLHYSNNPAF
jgi:hypothetical protein